MTKFIIYEPKIHKRVCDEMLEVRNKYLPLLSNKLRSNYNHIYADHQACIINDAIRKIAINASGKHRIESMDDEGIKLATIIMEDIYFYLIHGYVQMKEKPYERFTNY